MCQSAGTFESTYHSGQKPKDGDVVVEKKGRGPAGAQIVTGVCKDNSLRFKNQNSTKFDASDYDLVASGATLVNH